MFAKVFLALMVLCVACSTQGQTGDFNVTADRAVEVAFDTVVGRYYVVQKSQDIVPAVWSNYGDPIAGNGKRSFAFARSQDSSQSIFRVVEYDLSAGLVAYYPFDGNANDASSNLNHGTVNGATLTTDRFGNQNSAYSFNGTNQYIQCPNQSYLNFNSGDFSLSTWVNFANNSTNRFVLGKSDGQFNQNKWIIYHGYSPAQYAFHINTSSGNSSFSGSANWQFDSNSWHHLVIVKSGNIYETYLDGLKITEAAGTSSVPNTSTPLTIGMVESIGWMHGKIDDIRIYNRAISRDEVSILYKENSIHLDNGLVALYEFNGNANDSTTNSNHGTVVGATLTSDRFGNANQAYHFNGIDQLIQAPSKSYLDLSGNESSVSFWAKFEGTSSTRHILGKSDGAFNNNKWIFYYSTAPNQVSLHVNRISGGSTFSAPATFNYDTTTWHHFAITKSGTAYTMYIDGANVAQSSGPSPLPSTTGLFTMGSVEGLGWFQGSLDNVRVYSRSLNVSEIRYLYTSEE